MVQGQSVKRQATTTLRCMQALARVQSQIHARRIRMSEENEALQRQIQQKREKELEKLRTSVSVPQPPPPPRGAVFREYVVLNLITPTPPSFCVFHFFC